MYTESLTEIKPLSRWWLLLGVGALAVAGLFAIILVVARTPALAELPGFAGMFHKALVAHVDLSVLIWFLAIICLFFSVEAARYKAWLAVPLVEEAALISFALGALCIALSPFVTGEALMSNYIPVIQNPLFFLGLLLAACGLGLQLLHYFLHRPSRLEGIVPLGTFSAALMMLIALACFVWSVPLMPAVITGQQYYDMAFWGGGHVLQLVYGQVAILVWLLLVVALRPGLKPGWFLYAALSIGFIAAFGAVLIFVTAEISSSAFRQLFTHGVMTTGGLGAVLGALWALRHVSMPSQQERALFASLVMSLFLFLYGGLLGILITGQDVTIPAHYHGSIVGITIGFMGLTYLWLPRFGYADVTHMRLARWQPLVLGIGQILHISGLAWSGGYGVLRKTPGGVDALPTSVQAALGLMGLGGLLAIIGGLMFVIAVGKAVWPKRA